MFGWSRRGFGGCGVEFIGLGRAELQCGSSTNLFMPESLLVCSAPENIFI